MNASNYYNALNDFTSRHGISRNLLSRLLKVQEESFELRDAIFDFDHDETMKEAADLLNVCADIILILGGDPLQVAMAKLQEAAARPHYQQMAAEVVAQRKEHRLTSPASNQPRRQDFGRGGGDFNGLTSKYLLVHIWFISGS